jgi:hypothetical protein
MNLFFYPLQKDSKEKLLLAFNIIGNDVDRRCTCSHLQKIRDIFKKKERMILAKLNRCAKRAR